MEIKSGRRILRIAGAPGQTFVEKSPQMVFLSAVGSRICALVPVSYTHLTLPTNREV